MIGGLRGLSEGCEEPPLLVPADRQRLGGQGAEGHRWRLASVKNLFDEVRGEPCQWALSRQLSIAFSQAEIGAWSG